MKRWYLSKTLAINAVAFIALVLQAKYGKEVLSPEVQGMIIAAINFVLRCLSQDKLTLK